MTRPIPMLPAKLTLIAAFFACIFLPPIKTLVSPVTVWSSVEKRKLAELPHFQLSQKALWEVPQSFEAFYNDHFGYREQFIYRYNRYMRKYFGKTASIKVIIGKNDWLYLTEGKLIEDHLRLDPLTPEELEMWRINLEAKQSWLAERGIRYLFVIAPNKQTIYPENLPDYLPHKPGPSRLDQLVQYLRQRSNVNLLDLRGALLAAKQVGPVYHRTDTHWNHQGAFAAYRQIMERLRQWFPGRSIPEPVFSETAGPQKWQNDLATMAQLDEAKLENVSRVTFVSECARREPVIDLGSLVSTNPAPFRTFCDRADLTAVMFRDSFGNALQPFLSESFKDIVYIFDQYNHSAMQQLLERGRPDVVIEEMVERYLILIRPEAGSIPINPLADRKPAGPRG